MVLPGRVQVAMLKGTPFFSSWSDVSISRLYFWFERRRYAAETDVVKQGDDAVSRPL